MTTNTSDTSSSSKEREKTYLVNSAKPEGEACNADGTLKDASEMDWIHSPSQLDAAADTFGLQDGNEDTAAWDYWELEEENRMPRANIVSHLQ